MRREYTKDEFCHFFRVYITWKYGTITKAAECWGCSKTFVSLVAAGKREPSETMISELDAEIETTTVYRIGVEVKV